MLFDPETNEITALLDYDFGHIGSQADEYFYSLGELHGLLVPPFQEEDDINLMRERLLHGFDEQVASDKSEMVDWRLFAALDEQLAAEGVERPVDIPGIDQLSAIYWFLQDVSPPMFFLKRWRAHMGEEKVQEFRDRKSVV